MNVTKVNVDLKTMNKVDKDFEDKVKKADKKFKEYIKK